MDGCLEVLNRRPLLTNGLLILMAFPLVGVGTLPRPLVLASALRQGLLFGVAFDTIRAAAEWLASLYTSYWYVQMSKISVLEGNGAYTACGGYVVYGTIASLAFGLVFASTLPLPGLSSSR